VGHPEDGDDAAEVLHLDATDLHTTVLVDAAAVGDDVNPGEAEQARVVAALEAVLCGDVGLGPALRELLRDAADNDSRRRLKDALIGVVVLRRRLAWQATRGRGTATPAALLACFFDDDDADGPWPADPVEALGVRRSCPDWLARALIDSLGHDDADAFLANANRPGPVTLRANALRTDRAGLLEALASDGITARENPATPWAVDVVGHANLMGSRAFRDGRFEVQDASSQQVVVACGARPGDVVVDLCAGRGGKTLGLAAVMGDRGRLVAHDVDERALADLRGRTRRLGLRSVSVEHPDTVAGAADVVLVDAPCSSVGVLRRSPELRWRMQPEDLVALQETQRALLERASRLARPGGRVVYATCSVLRPENDDVAETAPPTLESESRRLLLPHRDGGDGFFIAVWRRR
jgi:16S rRNA (cytosine967-C5)-methyltransferase